MAINIFWHALTSAEIDRLVAKKPGAYILSRGKDAAGNPVAHYVGRSDDDVNRRLHEWERTGRYQMFAFRNEDTSRRAYEVECIWWHELQPADNQIHPAAPAGTGWPCPVKGCSFYRAA